MKVPLKRGSLPSHASGGVHRQVFCTFGKAPVAGKAWQRTRRHSKERVFSSSDVVGVIMAHFLHLEDEGEENEVGREKIESKVCKCKGMRFMKRSWRP